MHHIPFHHRISVRLSFIASCFIFLTLALFELYHFVSIKADMTQLITQKKQAENTALTKDIRLKIDSRIQFVDRLGEIIVTLPDHSREKLDATLRNHLDLSAYFNLGFLIVRPDGKGLLAEHPVVPGRKDLPFHKGPIFNEVRTKSVTTVSASYRGIDAAPRFLISKKLVLPNGTTLGYLFAPIQLNTMSLFGAAIQSGSEAADKILVIEQTQSRVIAASDGTEILSATPPNILKAIRQTTPVAGPVKPIIVDVNDEEYLISLGHIHRANWTVATLVNWNTTLEPLRTSLYINLFGGFVTSLAASFLIAITLHIFFQPLRRTAAIVRDMADENRALRRIPTTRHDEIGELIVGINFLVQRIQQHTTQLQDTTTQLENLSSTDSLTGLNNRRWFDQTLDHEWRAHAREQKPLSLLLLNIDNFKDYTDTYGSAAGDTCLTSVAKTLEACMRRPCDFLARYGGDEFAVILSDDQDHAQNFAELLRQAVIDLQIEHASSEHGVATISIGVASATPTTEDKPENLILAADDALYKAKEDGYNCVRTTL